MADKTILVVGTYDTKDDELLFMAERIRAGGGGVLTMDVSVLGEPSRPADISKHQVAEASGSSIQAAIESDDVAVSFGQVAEFEHRGGTVPAFSIQVRSATGSGLTARRRPDAIR